MTEVGPGQTLEVVEAALGASGIFFFCFFFFSDFFVVFCLRKVSGGHVVIVF